MDIFKRICLEQSQTIELLAAQNARLIRRLAQYTDMETEEKRLEDITAQERKMNGFDN